MDSNAMWIGTICSNLIIIFVNAAPGNENQSNTSSLWCFPCAKKTATNSPPQDEVARPEPSFANFHTVEMARPEPSFANFHTVQMALPTETQIVDTSTWPALHKQYWDHFGCK